MVRWLHARDLTHPLLALAMMAPFAALGSPWVGAALAVGFYWGREKRDLEIAAKADPVRDWWRHWLPLNRDFLLPLAAVSATLLLGACASGERIDLTCRHILTGEVRENRGLPPFQVRVEPLHIWAAGTYIDRTRWDCDLKRGVRADG